MNALPKGLHLYFDCFSGAAGDMTIGALIDLGVPFEVIQTTLAKLPLSGYRLEIERVIRKGITATKFHVRIDGDHGPTHHHHEHHHHKHEHKHEGHEHHHDEEHHGHE